MNDEYQTILERVNDRLKALWMGLRLEGEYMKAKNIEAFLLSLEDDEASKQALVLLRKTVLEDPFRILEHDVFWTFAKEKSLEYLGEELNGC